MISPSLQTRSQPTVDSATDNSSSWESQSKPRSSRSFGRIVGLLLRIATIVALLAVITVGSILAFGQFSNNQTATSEAGTYTVQLRTVDDTVVERGTLESKNTVHGRCELTGWENKIIKLVPEGTFVKKGELVAQLEADKIDQQIAQKKVSLNEAQGKMAQAKQELAVQLNKGESDVATAELELVLTGLDLEKYRDGDFVTDKTELERLIAEGQAQLEKVNDDRRNIEVLVKKGYRSPEQLSEFKLRESSYKFAVDRDRQKLRVLEKYDHKRKLTEFDAKATEAKRKLIRAKTTAEAEKQKAESAIASAENAVKLHESELKELNSVLAKSTLLAPQDGTVAYANQPWYGPEDRIREGASVRQQQDIFYLPDMANMQVRVNIHESVINRVKAGQVAAIRLDAFSDIKLKGKVTFVAELAASSYSNTKNYDALVFIEDIPTNLALKPGMTAEVEIMVGTYENIVAVPVGAITEHFQQSYCYLDKGSKYDRRAVKTGRMTHSFVEVLEGLNPGDKIALDAYQRGTADFAAAEREVSSKRSTPAAAPKKGTGG